jgi:Lon protease-like protein
VEGLDPATFSGRVPLFPLPNVVLFPCAALPLHIFEPRYRAMMREALSGERLIAMALLKPGYEAEYAGNPPVWDVVGIGRILEHEALADGRYNLVLWGVARARIVEVVRSDPYRTARVELLEDRSAEGEAYERRRRVLRAFYANQLRALQEQGAPISLPPEDVPLGLLCDLILHLLPLPPAQKQSFLEWSDVSIRCDRLLELLERIKDGPGPRPWPPSASAN